MTRTGASKAGREAPFVSTRAGLPNGYHAVASGKLAAVVTYLEMRSPPEPRPEFGSASWTLEHVVAPEPVRYRDVYTEVGRDYLWASRLLLDDRSLRVILHDAAVALYILRADDRDAGLIELDFRNAGECELTSFGVRRDLIGSGAGRWLMNRALAAAWSTSIERLWLHTCTLDHRAAPEFYVRSGFVPYKREVEIFDDPRVRGDLPLGSAPHIPML